MKNMKENLTVVKYAIIIQNKIEENIYYSPCITYIVEEDDKILIKQYKRKRERMGEIDKEVFSCDLSY